MLKAVLLGAALLGGAYVAGVFERPLAAGPDPVAPTTRDGQQTEIPEAEKRAVVAAMVALNNDPEAGHVIDVCIPVIESFAELDRARLAPMMTAEERRADPERYYAPIRAEKARLLDAAGCHKQAAEIRAEPPLKPRFLS